MCIMASILDTPLGFFNGLMYLQLKFTGETGTLDEFVDENKGSIISLLSG